MRNRVEIIHGVNLDQLGSREPEHYGTLTLSQLEGEVHGFARGLGLEATFWQTNHEGEFCEYLHRARDTADGLVLNPGAWTHYSYAIHDAIAAAGLPAVEVHISDIAAREEWRRESVIRAQCIGSVAGRGLEGYREALTMLKAEFAGG